MFSRLSFYCSSYDFVSKTSALGFLFLLVLWVYASVRKSELLSKLPGPKAYPIIGNLKEFLVDREEIFRQSYERNKKYGPIFIMWLGRMPLVILSDPVFFEEVLHSSRHIDKGSMYKIVESFLGSGLITATREKWLKHRKILTPSFHFKILDSFFGVFKENGKILEKLLDEKAETGKPFNFYNYAKNFALDNVCEAAMGVKVETQTSEGSEYARAAMKLAEFVVERTKKIWLSLDFLYYITPRGKEFLRLRKMAYDFVNNIIEERKRIRLERKARIGGNVSDVDEFGMKKRLAFLDILLDTAEKENIDLTIQDIRDEVNTFMFAGHDTTTAAISWAVFLIGHHPKIQKELYEEQLRISDDFDKPITLEDIQKMELLDRVMKESIRLYPSVPFIARTLDNDVKFGKYIVPKGTDIFLSIFFLHRNPNVFPEPNKFDPDRFLPENCAGRHSYAFVPFSAGPRNCIGKRFALLQEKVALALIIRRYEITSIEKENDLIIMAELVLRSKNGINITLKKRTHK